MVDRICGCRTCAEERDKALELIDKLTSETCPISAFLQTAMANVLLHRALTDSGQDSLLGAIATQIRADRLEDLAGQAIKAHLSEDTHKRVLTILEHNGVDRRMDNGMLDTKDADELLRNLKKGG